MEKTLTQWKNLDTMEKLGHNGKTWTQWKHLYTMENFDTLKT